MTEAYIAASQVRLSSKTVYEKAISTVATATPFTPVKLEKA